MPCRAIVVSFRGAREDERPIVRPGGFVPGVELKLQAKLLPLRCGRGMFTYSSYVDVFASAGSKFKDCRNTAKRRYSLHRRDFVYKSSCDATELRLGRNRPSNKEDTTAPDMLQQRRPLTSFSAAAACSWLVDVPTAERSVKSETSPLRNSNTAKTATPSSRARVRKAAAGEKRHQSHST